MKLKSLFAGIACCSLIVSTALQAQAPQMFRYQGRLLDNDTLVSGDLNFSFKLYTAPTGGAALYEDAATVTVVDGLYSTIIGDDTSSGGDLADALNNAAVYLEITVGGETLTPRERIVSVPYAMNDNGLPSGTVVLSATNPNPALEAQGYSLVYSDVTSPEDWAVALHNELAIPYEWYRQGYHDGLVSFGDYVGFLSDGSYTDEIDPFFYSRDGVMWSQSTPPFQLPSTGSSEHIVLNGNLYLFTTDQSDGLRVATTANGADWSELSVNSPVASISSLYEVQAFADQIWLFGSDGSSDGFILKSSDGASWTLVDSAAWDTVGLETQSTPERLLVLAAESGGGGTYVWSTTDGASWSRSNAMIPVSVLEGSNHGDHRFAFANGALWLIGSPEPAAAVALYTSTNWGDSWQAVSIDFPAISSWVDYMDLGGLPGGLGLILTVDGDGVENAVYNISENGSELTKLAAKDFRLVSISDSGQTWLYHSRDHEPELYSIGGPLRNGRFFYYQKD
jgi:hypothetical protein